MARWGLAGHWAPCRPPSNSSSCARGPCLLPASPQELCLHRVSMTGQNVSSFSSHVPLVRVPHDYFRAPPLLLSRAWLSQNHCYNFTNPFINSESSEVKLFFPSLCITALIIPLFPGAKATTDVTEGEPQSALWRGGGHRRGSVGRVSLGMRMQVET